MSDVLAPDHDPEPAPLERATLHADTLSDAERLVPERLAPHLQGVALAHLDDAVRTGLDIACRYAGDRAGIFLREHRDTIRRYVSAYAVELAGRLLTQLEDDTAPPLPAPSPPPVESSRPGRAGAPRHRARPLGDDDASSPGGA